MMTISSRTGSTQTVSLDIQSEHAVLALLKALQPDHRSRIDAIYWRWSHARSEGEMFSDFLIRQGVFDSHRQLTSALALFQTGMHHRSPIMLTGLISNERLTRIVEQTRAGDTSIFIRPNGNSQAVLQETRRETPPFSDVGIPEEVPDDVPLTAPKPPVLQRASTVLDDTNGFEVISETEVIVASTEETERQGGWLLPTSCFLESATELMPVLPAGTFVSCFLSPRDGEPIRLWPTKKYTLGSSPDSDILVPAAMNVPARLAQIVYSDYGFKLYDLERQGAVVVNGESTTEWVLNDQDEIRIGETVFHFLSGEESRMLRLFSLRFDESLSGRSRKVNDRFGTAAAFSGDLADIPIADLLQFLCSTRKTGSCRVMCGSVEAKLVLTDGHVTFAQKGAEEGPEVVYQLLGWTKGSFKFERIEEAERRKRNVSSTTVLLVMEGLRRLDEAARQNRETAK